MRVVVATLVVKAFEAVHIGSFDPVLRLNQVTIANRPTPPWPLLVPCCAVRFQNLGPLVAFRVIFQVGVGGLADVADGNGESTFPARTLLERVDVSPHSTLYFYSLITNLNIKND